MNRNRQEIILYAARFLLFSACVCPLPLEAQGSAKEAVSVDLLVRGATIVTMDAERRVIDNGYIAMRGDQIVALGANPATDYPKGLIPKQTIEANGKLLLPGLINGHTHIPMVLMRGLKDDVVLDEWLRKFIFPAEARNVTEDFDQRLLYAHNLF